MEDQGKRLLLAVAVAFAIMMAWSFLFPPEQEPEKDKKDGKDDAGEVADKGDDAPTPPGGDDAPTPPGGDDADAPPPAGETETPRQPAVETVRDFADFRVVFTNYGAAVKSWTLKGEQFENRTRGGQIDLAPTGRDDFAPEHDGDLYPLIIGFDAIEGVTSHHLPAKQEWKLEKDEPNAIHYYLETADLKVWKEYEIVPQDYLLRLTIKVKKKSGGSAKQALRLTTFHWQDPNEDTEGGWVRLDRAWRTACYMGESLNTNSVGYLRDKGAKTYRGKLGWAGNTHAYFLSGFALKNELDDRSKCIVSAVPKARKGTMRTDAILGPPTELEEGKSFARTFAVYIGPKYLGKLDEINEIAGFTTGLEESVDLGWFGFIARPLLWLLLWFQGFVVNWGIAIVMLTIVVKLATLYWTTKSMRSMRAMSKLRPKVEEIQKKYKGDRQKAQVEVMNLYKTHGVNPLSGCLPMVLQMPIWIALYQTLRVAAELYQAPLIPGWISDLTAPDPYYVMPVLLMGMMFVQAKLTPTTADSTQQKIMQYGLPLTFGVFGFFFPAGLTLYILTNTTLTALHHVYLRRTDDDHAAPAPEKKASADAPSGRKGAEKKASKSEADDDGDEASADESGPTGGNEGGAPRKKKSSKKRGPSKKKKRSR